MKFEQKNILPDEAADARCDLDGGGGGRLMDSLRLLKVTDRQNPEDNRPDGFVKVIEGKRE